VGMMAAAKPAPGVTLDAVTRSLPDVGDDAMFG